MARCDTCKNWDRSVIARLPDETELVTCNNLKVVANVRDVDAKDVSKSCENYKRKDAENEG